MAKEFHVRLLNGYHGQAKEVIKSKQKNKTKVKNLTRLKQ